MSKNIMMRQLRLESPSPSGIRHLVTYVEDDPRVKVGVEITLKDSPDPARRWRVVDCGKNLRNKKDIKTTWHNNI